MRDFRQALQQADEAVAKAGMPASADRRVQERLGLAEGRASTRSWTKIWTLAAVACAAALALVMVSRPGTPSPNAPSRLGAFAVRHPSLDFGGTVGADQSVRITAGQGMLVDEAEGVSLSSLAGGALKKEKGGVRVVAGVFEVAVAKRAKGAAPCRLLVSDGAIEVLGTRFTVRQQAGGGEVTLHEGSIRFVANDGRQVLLTPGEVVAWPLSPVAVVPPVEPGLERPEPASVKPVQATHPLAIVPAKQAEQEALKIEDLLQRIDELRSRGQFDQAASALEKALSDGYSRATRERLSFELGTILSRAGSDVPRSCLHWREHARTFPNGRYDREIDQAVKRLGCSEP